MGGLRGVEEFGEGAMISMIDPRHAEKIHLHIQN